MADNIPTADQSANEPVPSILSGAASQPTMPMPQVDTPSAPAPAPAPIPTAEQSANSPVPAVAQSDAPPAPAPKPGLWHGILAGALSSLVALPSLVAPPQDANGQVTGRGGVFGNLLHMGPSAEQKMLNMESLKASDAHVLAVKQVQRNETLNAIDKADLAQKNLDYKISLRDNLGIPITEINDSNQAVHGAFQAGAQSNNNEYPSAAIIHEPAPDGTHGVLGIVSPTNAQLATNSKPYHDLVDGVNQLLGNLPETDQSWVMGGPKAQRAKTVDAVNALSPTPLFSTDPKAKDFVGTQAEQLRVQLDRYKDQKDSSGQPTANPNIVKRAEERLDYLDTMTKKYAAAQPGGAPSPQQIKDAGATVAGYEKQFPGKFAGIAQEIQHAPTQELLEKVQARADADYQSFQRSADARQNALTMKDTAVQQHANDLLLKEDNTLSDTLALSNDIRGQLDLSRGGNQQATQDVWTAFAAWQLKSHNVNRITSAELKNLGPDVGSFVRQVQVGGDKFLQGKMPKVSAADLAAVLDLGDKEARATHDRRVANIDRDVRGQKAPTAAATTTDPAAQFGGVTR